MFSLLLLSAELLEGEVFVQLDPMAQILLVGEPVEEEFNEFGDVGVAEEGCFF